MKQQNTAILNLIQQFGGQVKLAKKLNLTQGTITGWLNQKHGISSTNAMKIEKLTNGKFRAIDLCPRLAEIEMMDTSEEAE